ncbi:oleate activated transcription factor 3 [Coleophoma cylindrospora]|uniref:Oleate activated transcription factor 3 n=1 Tax=Coleophoma cylindrospora TaxID=1849047 RepID=A0A3D8Q773_9HELO|nr:oleate activated transcription factor 3 [Coleophoma cylindrospora]
MRCNRESPCGACLRRGKPAECTYTSSEQERKDAVDYRPHAGGKQARQKVARLEKLVTQMRDQMRVVEQTSGSVSDIAPLNEYAEDPVLPDALGDGNVGDSVGKLSLTDDHTVYHGSTHWGTILEEIQSLKDELSDDYSDTGMSRESTPFDAGSMAGSSPTRISLLSSSPSLPKEQILTMIPPRKVVDRHVSNFFNAFDFASSILHRDRFLLEYSNFWQNPSAVPVMWIGLLCSIMSISAFLQLQDVAAPNSYTSEIQETLEAYRILTIHCLVAGDYLRPTRYTIETLTLHFAVDQNTNLDPNIGNWILIGVVVRIALRMGLHRDPSHWPSIRPLEAEFRRRLWITLYHMDFFTSTQVGLPRIIKDSQCDTRAPANLFDDDLSFEHDIMPPERPLTDATPFSHIIQRHAIIKIAAEIYDATEAGPPSSAIIAALAVKLEKAIDSIPESSKYRPLEISVADSPVTILHRMFIDILTHKAMYLLHRRSFTKSFVGEGNTNSSGLCINAALEILEHQRRMNEESQPGGIMFGIRWKVSSSLNHEFLQATMMLCFALNKFHETHTDPTGSSDLPRRDEIIDALTSAKSLWEKQANLSAEARKAGIAVTSVLKQNSNILSPPSLAAFDGVGVAPSHEQPISMGQSTGLSDQIPEVTSQIHLAGFDFGQNMIMDPTFSTLDSDMGAYGSLWDDFLSEPMDENQTGVC